MSRESLLPPWAVGAFLLTGTGAFFVLSKSGLLDEAVFSWPLLVCLVGVAVVLGGGVRFLAFGGVVAAIGLAGFLHLTNRCGFDRSWPWLLIVAALLVVADRWIDASARPPREAR